jgi:energy-coupling factor transporter ATP-binding protein EcfA2
MSVHDTTTRVRDLKLARLDQLFRPPGLPLVRKDPASENATTAILVRGQAGSGKTTLVTALAHAIASHGQGIALFLNTEAFASELRYKADFLGLPANSLLGWSARAEASVGALVTQHVELTPTGRTAKDSKDRRLASFRAVEEMLQQAETNPSGHPPIRVVVLDGFTLPGAEQEPPDLRHEVISFLQELEAHGVTPILVEEVGPRGFEWLPFVVDLVFELSLEQDPDTGKLIRRLRCPKSRFSRCHPGPHDYGVEHERPALWPDPLDVLSPGDFDSAEKPPDFIWPDAIEDRYLLLSGPGVIASYYDKQEANILRPHFHTPGTRTLKIVCGSEIELLRDDTRVASVPESDGPYALAWAVFEHARDCNFISVGQMPGLMRRQRFRLPLLHMLDALARAGKRVCVHGAESDLASTDNLGTVLLPILRHPRRTLLTMRRRKLLSGIRWVDPPAELFAIEAASNKDLAGAALLEKAAQRLAAATSATLLEIHRDVFTWTEDTVSISEQPGQIAMYLSRDQLLPATLASAARLVFYQHRVGEIDLALANLAHVRIWAEHSAIPALHSCIAWISALLGEDWHAARIVSRALRHERISPLDQLLWSCLRVTYTGSEPALEELLTAIDRSTAYWQTQLSAAFVTNSVVALRGAVKSSKFIADWLGNILPNKHGTRLLLDAVYLATDDAAQRDALRGLTPMVLADLELYEWAFNCGLLGKDGETRRNFEIALNHPLLAAAARLQLDRLPGD